MAIRRTLAAACTALALCAAAQDDYLDSELRARVEALKSAVAAEPTGPGTREERVRVLWDWMNAYSLTGGTLPVNAVFVAMSVLTYPDSADGTGATVDAFVREFTLLDEQPAAIGALTADLGPYVAGAFVTVRQTYTVATKPIEPGGGFLVTRHFMAGYGRWQTEDPAADHYISISSSNPDVRFVADGHPLGGMHGGFRSRQPTLLFRVEAGTLNEGDTATITYGDTSGGSRGLRMSTISSDRMPLPLYLDFDGSKLFFTLPIQHIIVSGAETAGVHGFAPSVVATREPFDLSVRAEDRYYNRGTGAIPGWEILLNGDPFRSLDAGGDAIQLVEDVSLDAPGVYRFTIRSPDGSIVGEANPVLVEDDPQRRVYWGDTHGHSGFAEGIGTPDRFMTWARDDARLDYVMHSEHDIWLDDYEWNVLADNVRRFTEEGEFIAYLGYEWTVNNRQGGHHNVLFRTPDDRMPIRAQFFPTLSNLYQGLRTHHDPRDVVVIPHAHQNGEYRLNDPLLEPLIEIMSNHGTFEWFGRMYLSHGHQVGFTAASDNHLSQPGVLRTPAQRPRADRRPRRADRAGTHDRRAVRRDEGPQCVRHQRRPDRARLPPERRADGDPCAVRRGAPHRRARRRDGPHRHRDGRPERRRDLGTGRGDPGRRRAGRRDLSAHVRDLLGAPASPATTPAAGAIGQARSRCPAPRSSRRRRGTSRISPRRSSRQWVSGPSSSARRPGGRPVRSPWNSATSPSLRLWTSTSWRRWRPVARRRSSVSTIWYRRPRSHSAWPTWRTAARRRSCPSDRGSTGSCCAASSPKVRGT